MLLFLLNLHTQNVDGATLVTLLLLLNIGCGDSNDVTCESNLDCCQHLPWSTEFQECCSDRDGCCPDCQNVHYVPAMKSYAMKNGCEASYECCVYPIFSDEWLNCCSKHHCCSLCHMVSKGCCYNEKMYQWGNVVDNFPEIYTNLVCGAKLYKTEPYFVATIVSVLSLPVSETDDHCREQQNNNYCIEKNGIIYVDGSEWFKTPCLLCRCAKGYSDCKSVRPKCPPAPYPECYPISPTPGDCCHAWDCSRLESMCIDAYGKVRQEGEQWTGLNEPCLLYMCKPGGMVLSAYRRCPPPQAATVPLGCELQTRPEECCPLLHCPECYQQNGTSYSKGDTWADPENPCFTYHCLAGGTIQHTRKSCPQLYRPASGNCVLQQEDCCPKWICGGCVDQQGKVHAPGAIWTDPGDPCITNQCSDRGIRLSSRDDCSPLSPKPAQSCYKIKKNCCYEWKCLGDKTYCIDDQGVRREAGEDWIDPVNPCIHCHCTEDFEILKAIRDCAQPPPRPSPSCIMEVEQCCPVWRCPCVDEVGVERVVEDIWEHPTNKCLSLECTSDGVQEKLVLCPKVPPRPDPLCVLQLDGCCLAWTCPEECPDPFSFNINCFRYFDQCYSDRECGPRKKCCLVAGCGKECMTVSKPGKCPVIHHIVAPQCIPDMKDDCQVDHQCPGYQKCCVLDCTKRCVDPF